MRLRDPRHPPPPSPVLDLVAKYGDNKGDIRGGWGVTADRPAKADQIRERLSALAWAAPAQ